MHPGVRVFTVGAVYDVYDRPQFVRLARSWAVTDRPYSGVTATLCAKPAAALLVLAIGGVAALQWSGAIQFRGENLDVAS